MTSDAYETYRQKVAGLFAELAEGRSTPFNVSRIAHDADGVIESALSSEFSTSVAHDIAFHLSDWGHDAAFLMAVHLFPERFTTEEIQKGVQQFLIHAPNHIAAAAHLAGWPVRDVFKLGLELAE